MTIWDPTHETIDRERLEALQLERLRDMLARAYERVPLYRARLREVGFEPGDLKGLDGLAGLPFTVGFLGKFFIFEAAMREQHYMLVAIGLVTVACGFYYYLKVVRAMYWQPVPADAGPVDASPLTRFAVGVLAALILIIGIFPRPLLQILP